MAVVKLNRAIQYESLYDYLTLPYEQLHIEVES